MVKKKKLNYIIASLLYYMCSDIVSLKLDYNKLKIHNMNPKMTIKITIKIIINERPEKGIH